MTSPPRVGLPSGRITRFLPLRWRQVFDQNPRTLQWLTPDYHFFYLRSKVIPHLVARGQLDFGFCGSDNMAEFPMPELLDSVKVGEQTGVRLAIAAKDHTDLLKKRNRPLVVGTPYPVLAAKFLSNLGLAYVIVEQPGCSEGLCPALVDVVLDVVETGATLEANGLVVLEELGALNVVRVSRKSKS